MDTGGGGGARPLHQRGDRPHPQLRRGQVQQYSTVEYSTVQYSTGVDRVEVHTAPSQETGENLSRVDLAVVRVEGSISLATHTPLCLPQPGMEVRGGNITLAGQQTLDT